MLLRTLELELGETTVTMAEVIGSPAGSTSSGASAGLTKLFMAIHRASRSDKGL